MVAPVGLLAFFRAVGDRPTSAAKFPLDVGLNDPAPVAILDAGTGHQIIFPADLGGESGRIRPLRVGRLRRTRRLFFHPITIGDQHGIAGFVEIAFGTTGFEIFQDRMPRPVDIKRTASAYSLGPNHVVRPPFADQASIFELVFALDVVDQPDYDRASQSTILDEERRVEEGLESVDAIGDVAVLRDDVRARVAGNDGAFDVSDARGAKENAAAAEESHANAFPLDLGELFG